MKCLVLFFISFLPLSSFTQWMNYNVNNTKGLQGTIVTSIIEDNDTIYFATDEGVSVWDKNNGNWPVYNTENGLGHNFVYDLAVDADNMIWAATNGGGVSFFNGGSSWESFTIKDGLSNNIVRCLIVDQYDMVWCGTYGGGLSIYNPDDESWSTIKSNDGICSNLVLCLYQDQDNTIWMGSSGNGLCYKQDTAWEHVNITDGLAGDVINVITSDASGNIWVGTTTGLSLYSGDTWTAYTTNDGLISNKIYSIIEDNEGTIWIGTDKGVNKVPDGIMPSIQPVDSIDNKEVISICQTGNNDFWFGMVDDGAVCYNGIEWKEYRQSDGLASNIVYDVLGDSKGNIWAGTKMGLSKFDGSSWQTFTTNDGLPYNKIYNLAEDMYGNIWMSHPYYGVTKYDGENLINYTTQDGLLDNGSNCIYACSDGNIMIGSSDGVSVYTGELWETITTANGLLGNYVNDILEDSKGNLWFCHYYRHGVTKHSDTGFHYYLLDYNVIYVAEDIHGNIWFLLDNYGIAKFDGTSFTYYTDIFSSNYIYCLAEDSKGNLWCSYYEGLSKYNGFEWSNYYNYEKLGYYSANNISEDINGSLWFATYNGLTKYDYITSVPQISENNVLSAFVHPNPATDNITFSYSIRVPSNMVLRIYNAQGILIMSCPLYHFYPGNYSQVVNLDDWQPGNYFYCLLSNNLKTTGAFIIK